MKGVHVVCAAPRGGRAFKTKYEFLTAALSALEWRGLGADIIMFTDIPEYFTNLNEVWNDIRTLPDMNINHKIFWAGAKLYAIREMKPPFCMIDTDFIVWKMLEFRKKAAAVHDEDLTDIYKEYGDFFENGYSRAVRPVNAAFTYINDLDFSRLYTSEAISFMESYNGAEDFLSPMIFAEQRMFAMCAEKLGIDIQLLSDLEALSKNGADGYFTHLWGYKRILERDESERIAFENRLLNRIKKDFPENYDKITERAENDY